LKVIISHLYHDHYCGVQTDPARVSKAVAAFAKEERKLQKVLELLEHGAYPVALQH
jgi:hypothetical protein